MGIPATSPETVIATLIDTGTSLTLGTDLFSGPPRPQDAVGIPRSAVFVFGLLSFMPTPYLGVGEDFREFRVEIYIRQAQDQYTTGVALARTIWDAVQRKNVTSSGYVGVLMAEADPQYIGLDDQRNHRWRMAAKLLYKG